MKILKALYIQNKLFYSLGFIVALFLVSYTVPLFFYGGLLGLLLLLIVCILDGLFLFGQKDPLEVDRKFDEQMSLGDANTVNIYIKNCSTYTFQIELIDELPFQLENRQFNRKFGIAPDEENIQSYQFIPVKRGKYEFGSINIYLKSFLGFISRRLKLEQSDVARVFPSIVQMKKYEIKIMSKTASFHGIKKIRRLGMNNEFEQIKPYVQGDDYRVINWKATSRLGDLMVNQYQDERSQQVYCILDKSRSMRMPFNGMSLLDYAINSTLTISNICMLKGDKAGLITFSDKLGSRVQANRNGSHLKRIMETLYSQKTRFNEANYELLYYSTRQHIKGRSMILLYTNFESRYALERALPILRRINRTHLLVVVFFENTEIGDVASLTCNTVKDIYVKTLAEKYAIEKSLIVRELSKYGIQAILSKPEDLSVSTINKYLELKSRGMI